MRAATTALHTAHARCSEGIAANWSAGMGPPGPLPNPATAPVSTNPTPGSSLGGMTGRKKKTVMPTALVTTRALRALR
jgi:hypothetical protein